MELEVNKYKVVCSLISYAGSKNAIIAQQRLLSLCSQGQSACVVCAISLFICKLSQLLAHHLLLLRESKKKINCYVNGKKKRRKSANNTTMMKHSCAGRSVHVQIARQV